MIKLKNVSKSYSGKLVLNNLSFEISQGKCLALFGPSGSGKTTCLKLINRLLEPDSGEIYINGKSVRDYKLVELRRKVSYLFQKGVLFPHMTVKQNIALPLGDRNLLIDGKVRDLLQLIDLEPEVYLNRYPHQLSGGQAQRVSLAQAMAIDPDVLLLDEPFAGLDFEIKRSLMEKLLEIKNSLKKTMILVTHDRQEAEYLSDVIHNLNCFTNEY